MHGTHHPDATEGMQALKEKRAPRFNQAYPPPAQVRSGRRVFQSVACS